MVGDTEPKASSTTSSEEVSMLVTYAVYDVDTGEVLHIHVESADLGSTAEEIVQIADVQGARRLAALQLAEGEVPDRPSVVVDGRLQATESQNWGGADVDEKFSEPEVERQYVAGFSGDAPT
jgi:hypothetical protein